MAEITIDESQVRAFTAGFFTALIVIGFVHTVIMICRKK